MSKSVALLYNFTGEKLKMTKMACMMMSIRFKEIPKVDYNQPLGALLGIEGIETSAEQYSGEEFEEEMILLSGFDGSKLQQFLMSLQRIGVGKIDLKAMLTENNKTWSGIALYKELCEERDAFKKLEAEKRANKNK